MTGPLWSRTRRDAVTVGFCGEGTLALAAIRLLSMWSSTVSKQHLKKAACNDRDRDGPNGIDVDQLLATIDAIKDDSNVVSFTFRLEPLPGRHTQTRRDRPASGNGPTFLGLGHRCCSRGPP
jgi:hypothetical protein